MTILLGTCQAFGDTVTYLAGNIATGPVLDSMDCLDICTLCIEPYIMQLNYPS